MAEQDYAVFGKYILGEYLDPSFLGTFTFLYMFAMFFISLFYRKENFYAKYYKNHTYFNLMHNSELENEYLKEQNMSNAQLLDRYYLYMVVEWIIDHDNNSKGIEDFYLEASKWVFGIIDGKLDYRILDSYQKKVLIILYFMTVKDIVVSNVYLDTVSIMENQDEIYLCKEGEIIEKIKITYTENNIIFTDQDGREQVAITQIRNKEREVM